MKPKPKYKITIEETLTGKIHLLSMTQKQWCGNPCRGQYLLRYNDGPAKEPETTITKVSIKIRELLVEAEKNG